MTELFTVYTPPAAWARFRSHFTPHVRSERIAVRDALDRILAASLTSPQDLPEFPRSTVDGYAVSAVDTFGATPGLPALLTVVGEVPCIPAV
jgi:molybdopterin molybdotransferase